MFCDEPTGDFGNGLEATSVGDLRLVWSICGKLIARHFGSFATVSARTGPPALSVVRLLTGVERTRHGLPVSVANDPGCVSVLT
jgi:hypothetical protein